MTITVNHLQAVDEPASVFRRVLLAALAKSSATTLRDGVIGNGLAVSDGASGMDVVVAPGPAAIAGYLLVSDANVTVTLDAGGAATRTDLIIARVYDAEAGDAQSQGAVEVVKGTTAAEPALPARSIRLAAVTVAAGANSISAVNITDRRAFTGGSGPVWAPGALASAPSGLVQGTEVYDPQADQIGIVDGGAWRKFLPDTQIADLIAAAAPNRLMEMTRGDGLSVPSSATPTNVGMGTVIRSTGGGWSSAGGWITVPSDASGWYAVTLACALSANTSGRRMLILRDENDTSRVSQGSPPLSSGSTPVSLTWEGRLAGGAQLRMAVLQDSGSALTLSNIRMTARLVIPGVS